MVITQPQIDLAAVKRRQQATWASGDYAVIGTTLSITGELLCAAVEVHPGQRVLDVAAGNGNATLAAARRGAAVTSTDYVPALLAHGRERAAAERLPVRFQESDAEALPFADGTFDAVLSVFGVMFTADQERAAGELLRSAGRAAGSGSQAGHPRASSATSFGRSAGTSRPRWRPVARAVGHRAAVARAVWDGGDRADHHPARVCLSRTLARAPARRFSGLLWADAQGVRGAPQRGPGHPGA